MKLLILFILSMLTFTASATMIQPVAVSTDMGTAFPVTNFPVTNLINQSGLSATYTSGFTDLDTYAATTTHTGSASEDQWASNFEISTGVVSFDLGSIVNLDRLVLWNLGENAGYGLNGFTVHADSDMDFSNGVTSTLESFSASDSINTGQVFDFTNVSSQYIHIQITSNHGESLTDLGEVAFDSAAVPEPTTILGSLLVLGFAAQKLRKKKA